MYLKPLIRKTVFIGSVALTGFYMQVAHAFQVHMINQSGKSMRVSCKSEKQSHFVTIEPKTGETIPCDGYHYLTWNGSYNREMYFKNFEVHHYDKVKVNVYFAVKEGSDYCSLALNYNAYGDDLPHWFSVTPGNCPTTDYLKEYRVGRGEMVTVHIKNKKGSF